MKTRFLHFRVTPAAHAVLETLALQIERSVPWVAARMVENLAASMAKGRASPDEWLAKPDLPATTTSLPEGTQTL